MLNLILKSIVIGVVSTGAIEITYGIGEKGILGGINIAIIIIAFIALRSVEEKNEEKKIKADEELKRFNDSLLVEVKNRDILKSILEELRDKSLIESILTEVTNKDVIQTILEEVKDKTILNNILEELKDKTIFESILSGINDKNELENILKIVKDKTILEDIKESIEDTKDDIVRGLLENKKSIIDLNKKFDSELDTLIETTEKNGESYREVTEIYKSISNETITKLLQISKSNEHYLNLLKDTYKVLNVMCER